MTLFRKHDPPDSVYDSNFKRGREEKICFLPVPGMKENKFIPLYF
jgi:hypothetical protein